jgi:hypothetical protein
VTFCKRKRGVLKKAIELSRLCDQHVFMVIFDQSKQRIVEFSSKPEFNAKVVAKLTDPLLESAINHSKFCNEDYHMFHKGEKGEEKPTAAKERVEPPKKRRRKGSGKPVIDLK